MVSFSAVKPDLVVAVLIRSGIHCDCVFDCDMLLLLLLLFIGVCVCDVTEYLQEMSAVFGPVLTRQTGTLLFTVPVVAQRANRYIVVFYIAMLYDIYCVGRSVQYPSGKQPLRKSSVQC